MTDTLHTLNDESPATGLTLTVNGRDWVFTPGAVVALAEATGDRPEASSALIVAGLEAAKLDAGANHVDVFGVPLIVRVTDRRVVIGVDEAEIAEGLGNVSPQTEGAHTLNDAGAMASDNAILAEGIKTGSESDPEGDK